MRNILLLSGLLLIGLGTVGLLMPVFTTEHTSDLARIGNVKIESHDNVTHVIPRDLGLASLVLGAALAGFGIFRTRG